MRRRDAVDLNNRAVELNPSDATISANLRDVRADRDGMACTQEVVANTLHDIERGIAKMRERSGGIDEELEDLTGAALHYVFKP